VLVEPGHVRVDVAVDGSRALAVHDTECPELGPICAVRAEPPQQHHTVLWLWEARLLAEYGLASGWALDAVAPFRVMQTRTSYTDLAGNPITLDYENIHHRNETLTGLGDPQLWIHHGVTVSGFALSQRLGVSLPLGKIEPDPVQLGELGIPHEHFQFGTGTVDPMAGVDASRDLGPVALAAFAQAQVPLFAGRYGYQAGARFLGGVEAQRRVGPITARLGATLAHELPERWFGVVPLEDGNQGRTDLFVGAGATVPLGDWSISVDVHARAWGHVVGAQLDMPVIAEVSFGRLVHFDSGTGAEVEEGDVQDAVTAGEATALVPEAGRWTVFDFWAPWCEGCKRVDAELRAIAARDARVAVRRVNVVDFDSAIARQELPGVDVLPHLRVVGPDGKVRLEESGTPDALLGRLSALLSATDRGGEARSPPPP
jgi:thiol-disulfide isomerase/thioredoxin